MSVKIIKEIKCDICECKIIAPACRVILTMYGKEQDSVGGLLYTHLVRGDNEFDVCGKCAIKIYNGQTVLRKELPDK
jgi:hypothetical protein